MGGGAPSRSSRGRDEDTPLGSDAGPWRAPVSGLDRWRAHGRDWGDAHTSSDGERIQHQHIEVNFTQSLSLVCAVHGAAAWTAAVAAVKPTARQSRPWARLSEQRTRRVTAMHLIWGIGRRPCVDLFFLLVP